MTGPTFCETFSHCSSVDSGIHYIYYILYIVYCIFYIYYIYIYIIYYILNIMYYILYIILFLLLLYSGWWFQPLRKILVSWGYYSQYMDK